MATQLLCPSCQKPFRQPTVLPFYCRCGFVINSVSNVVEFQKASPIVGGPGTEMLGLTKELGITEKPNCTCRSVAKKMDAWGVAGCILPENHAWIVGQLTENAKRYSWSDAITAASVAALSPSLLDVQFLCKMAYVGWAEALIDKAIRQAEAKSAKM